jgi:hypothetical protein
MTNNLHIYGSPGLNTLSGTERRRLLKKLKRESYLRIYCIDHYTYRKYFQTRQCQKSKAEAWKDRELVEGGRQGPGAGWAARRGEVAAARGVQAGRTVGDVPGSAPCSKYRKVVLGVIVLVSTEHTICSTTGKPTHLFRTKCVSLDSV